MIAINIVKGTLNRGYIYMQLAISLIHYHNNR